MRYLQVDPFAEALADGRGAAGHRGALRLERVVLHAVRQVLVRRPAPQHRVAHVHSHNAACLANTSPRARACVRVCVCVCVCAVLAVLDSLASVLVRLY